jgi:hypothetical protein
MFFNIRSHLNTDEELQSKVESDSSVDIERLHRRNKLAFKRYAPKVLSQLEQAEWDQVSVFSNSSGELNLVNFWTGQTLYGLSPKKEALAQYKSRVVNSPVINFEDPKVFELEPLQTHIDCLVLLGVGLGHHILHLVQNHAIQHLIIYEPELSYFKGSMLANEWFTILNLAAQRNTRIYFQLGADGTNIVEDLKELRSHFQVGRAVIFKHYNCLAFNAIAKETTIKCWEEIIESGISWAKYKVPSIHIPRWTPAITQADWSVASVNDNALYLKNIAAFERFFPNIAKQFQGYDTQRWTIIEDSAGNINMLSMEFNESFMGQNPVEDCKVNFTTFSRYPNLDGVVLGYDGEKLKKYTHYRFVKATEKLLDKVEEQKGEFPQSVKALIMFGLMQGYQLEFLLDSHDVENLFICEPEPDFFYASLFAIDWSEILKKLDQSESRIYINIGDNGENLFRDLIDQFYAIGPYVLANTFFYQSYYRPDLLDTVSQLREQLQVVIAMGETYDHARYGIAHTIEMINQGTGFLKLNSHQFMSIEDRETPVFIVGNGPSLDKDIDILKEERNKVILVSCGTSLQPLLRSGITPDFHAEIEQNRATFDWIYRTNALKTLKDITLISCNGIHPDTAVLFKETLLAFKEGESSTISSLKILSEDRFTKLEFAFPTVANFVTNLFLEMRFTQLYFVGVDLGYVDKTAHHSSSSGYYDENGAEMYDYQKQHNASIQVPGNFRDYVSTKYEFKIAKEIIEQSFSKACKEIQCYNCSDGAKIMFTTPLKGESVLILSSPQQKENSTQSIRTLAFEPFPSASVFKQDFLRHYDHELLKSQLDELIRLTSDTIDDEITLDEMITQQKEMAYDSYTGGKSLLFYILYGSSNYANATFSKLAVNEEENHEYLKAALNEWKSLLLSIKHEYCHFPYAYDFAYSMRESRESLAYSQNRETAEIELFCEGPFWEFAVEQINKDWPRAKVLAANQSEAPNFIFCLENRHNDEALIHLLCERLKSCAPTTVVLGFSQPKNKLIIENKFPEHSVLQVVSHMPVTTKSDVEQMNLGHMAFYCDIYTVHWMTVLALNEDKFEVIAPKVRFKNALDPSYFSDALKNFIKEIDGFLEFPQYIVLLAKSKLEEASCLDFGMSRARPIARTPNLNDLVAGELVEEMLAHYSHRILTKKAKMQSTDSN